MGSIRHARVIASADSGDGKVSTNAWNDDHVFTGFATRTQIAALSPTTNQMADLAEAGREGTFVWDGSDLSAAVTVDTAQGLYVAPATDPTGASGAWVRRLNNGPILGNWFGMKVDGVTNDTLAADAFSKFIQYWKGGWFAIVRSAASATCILGLQPATGQTALNPFPPVVQYPLDITGCDSPVLLDASGIKFKLPDGYKYGAFNLDGTPKSTSNGYTGDGLSTPLYAFFRERGNSGGVTFLFGEMDGNQANASLGGKWGDNDWQVAGTGIQLGHWDGDQSTCARVIEGQRVHHMPEDGITLSHPGLTDTDPIYPVTLRGITFDYSGRNNFSWVGGKGVTAIGCKFNRAAKGSWASAPRKGIDFEPEGGAVVMHGEFINCEFIDNMWAGVGNYGGAGHITFRGCKFVGTTGASITDTGPHWSFHQCVVTGQMVNLYPSANAAEATQFYECQFLFGTARSPTGVVYAPSGHMADLGGLGAQNITFHRCLLDAESNTAVRISYLSGCTFEDCTLKQPAGSAAGVAQYCLFKGNNTITAVAGVDLYFSNNVLGGRTLYNGVDIGTYVTDPVTTYYAGGILAGYNQDGTTNDNTSIGVASVSGGYYMKIATQSDVGRIAHVNQDVPAWKPINYQASSHTFYINFSTVASIDSSGLSVTGTMAATGAVSGSNLNTSGFPTSVATGTIVGRSAAGTGAASALTTLPTAAMPALTGDVTNSAGSLATTIAAGAVTTSKMASMAANTVLANATASSASPTAVAIGASQFLGRGSSGDIVACSVGPSLSIATGTLKRAALVGDVTATIDSNTLTIASNAVTYAKMQDVSATQRLVGRNTAGAGDPEEVTATQALDWIGSTQGQVLYRSGTAWTALATGTSGQFLKTQGAAANPVWADAVIGVTTANGVSASLASGNLTFTLGAITPSSVAAAGAVTSSSATAGIGYASGAGGTVTQATSKSTGVTLNKICGQITMNAAALAANTGVSFTVTNSAVAATDTIDLVLASGNATAGTYNYQVDKVSAGSFVVWVKNISGGSLSEALVFNFTIKKAVAA